MLVASYKTVQYLKKGACIYILCTARFAMQEQLTPAVNLLQSWGFTVKLGSTINKVNHQLGGTPQERITDFVEAYRDPEIDAIWVARGGYGTVQIIDEVLVQLHDVLHDHNFKHPLFVGYSDVTVLHTALQKHGLPTVHTFMPLEADAKPNAVLSSLHNALSGNKLEVVFENTQHLTTLELLAPVIGGNLSILYSLIGSQTLPDFKGHILFIEDIDEYLYHIERMLYALKRAEKLAGLKALLVGGMTAMRDHEIPFGKTAQEIITDLTASYDYPVIFNFPAGHIDNNHSIILGKEMHINIGATTITCTQ